MNGLVRTSVWAIVLASVASLTVSAAATTILTLRESGATFAEIGLAHGESGLLRDQLVPRVARLLGPPRVTTGHMCPGGYLSVEVDRWGDLSMVFARGEFIELDDNRGGWPTAQRAHPPLPRAGARLAPPVVTSSGIAVGTTLARARRLDPTLRGSVTSLFLHGHLQLAVTHVPSRGWVVSQISARYGNPC